MPDLQGPSEPANVTWALKSSVTEDPFHIFKIILVLNYFAGGNVLTFRGLASLSLSKILTLYLKSME